METDSLSHMQSALLPVAAESALQLSSLPAIYDEQLGMTFAQSFSNLAFNVTAVPQVDSDSYGPAYLLNGLSNDGYWYQVGLSYNWPNANVGYNSGFNFNYEVFDSAKQSVYPFNSGGLKPFSGTVNAGDSVLLNIYINNGVVNMTAKDWNTGATAQVNYADSQTSSFIGLSTASNSNGFFSGLMTEWYHATVYNSNENQVTFSNPASSLSSAWMWMDEWEPSNSNWVGKWSTSTQVSYSSNPTQFQSLSSHGATEYSNAYLFITGSIVQQTTSITLLPAGDSTSLSATNEFTVWFSLDGQPQLSYAQNGTLTFTADNGTGVVISGVSSGSLTSTEDWTLNSQGTNVTITAGSNVTFYYYDLLSQQAAYSVSGGGNPPSPTLTYYTAPLVASGQFNQTINSVSFSPSQQTIMVLRGTIASVNNPITDTLQEQWTAFVPSWSISQANQIPNLIIYYHQYQVGASYSTQDDSTPTSNIALSATQFGEVLQQPLTKTNQPIWLDAGTLWSVSPLVSSDSGTEQWSLPAGASGSITGAITINPAYLHQYYLTVNSPYGNSSGSGWYNSGANAYAGLSSGLFSNETSVQYVFNSWSDAASGSTYTLSNGITMKSALTATATWITQYYLTVNSAFGTSSGSGWYNAGENSTLSTSSPVPESLITQHVCTGWNGTGSTPANGATTSLQFTVTQPSTVTWNWQSQFVWSTILLLTGVPLITAIVGLSIFLLKNRQAHKKRTLSNPAP